MNPSAIHLHIDELVLDGFDPRQRHEIADTLQRELTALAALQLSGAVRTESFQLDRADGGEFLVAGRTAGSLGRQIATAVNSTVGTALQSRHPAQPTARSR